MEKTNSSPCLTDLDSSLTNRMSISKCKIVHGGDDNDGNEDEKDDDYDENDDDTNDNDDDEDDNNDNNVCSCNNAIFDCSFIIVYVVF